MTALILLFLIGMGVMAISNGAIKDGVVMLLSASLIILIWVIWKLSKKPLICPINGQNCGKNCAWYDPREEPHCWRVKYEEEYEEDWDDEEDWVDEDDEEDWEENEEWEEEKPRRRRGSRWPTPREIGIFIDTDKDLDPRRRF